MFLDIFLQGHVREPILWGLFSCILHAHFLPVPFLIPPRFPDSPVRPFPNPIF